MGNVPAIAFIGRSGSGKTTLVEKVIAQLTARGYRVGSIKHHGHRGFDIDQEGKDSWRHTKAGSHHTVVLSPDRFAEYRDLDDEPALSDIVASMEDVDVVVVEGFKQDRSLPRFELFREGNPRDATALEEQGGFRSDAVVTDRENVRRRAAEAGLPCFGLDDVDAICDQVERMLAITPGSHPQSRLLDELTVVIQAGGESRRMGTNKSVVPFLGEPLIMRPLNRLSFLTDDLVITTNEPAKLDFLSEDYGRDDVRLVSDGTDRRGALLGMRTALAAARHRYVALVACDMVFASAPLVRREYELAREGGYDLVIPHQGHGFEPFHAVYRRDTCLEMIDAALEKGEIKASSWYGEAKMRELDRAEVLATDPRGGAFLNVNTPDELRAVEKRILEDRMTMIDGWPGSERMPR